MMALSRALLVPGVLGSYLFMTSRVASNPLPSLTLWQILKASSSVQPDECGKELHGEVINAASTVSPTRLNTAVGNRFTAIACPLNPFLYNQPTDPEPTSNGFSGDIAFCCVVPFGCVGRCFDSGPISGFVTVRCAHECQPTFEHSARWDEGEIV